jgi:hypothetical protein
VFSRKLDAMLESRRRDAIVARRVDMNVSRRPRKRDANTGLAATSRAGGGRCIPHRDRWPFDGLASLAPV